MIRKENNVFHLFTDSYSYLLKINGDGIPEHLYFGEPVKTEDAQALSLRPGLGWGASVLTDEKNPAGCLDTLALEWSGSGRGDYRESPLELLGTASDFRFVSDRVFEGSDEMLCGLPQAHGGSQTLELTFTQKGAALKLYYTVFPTALVRRAVVENQSQLPMVLHKCMSFCLDLPGSYTMTSFHGGWISEMGRRDTPVQEAKVVCESHTGSSSNRNNPGFLLAQPGANEHWGQVYGFNLIYSGNHYASAQRSAQGLTRVMQGINPAEFSQEIAPGRCFETPEAVLCVSREGYGGLSRQMHRFVTDHIVPPFWRSRPRPVVFNSWEGCMFDFNQSRLTELAAKAKKLGCELFVLDDGWFGQRNDDRAGLGDYDVNTRKLPGGLEGLSRKIHALGLEFGLWFEPESVNEDSGLYRAHPDWALTDDFPKAYGRHQLLLDLTRQEVQDYIVENVSRILDSAEISYVKWDMNRHSVALGAKAHQYILGLYSVLHRIFAPRPEILLETCSSGGNRFDLGMLCYGPQIWTSDDTDPIERLKIQTGCSYLYPQSTMAAHVSAAPHAQTLRTTPLSTRGNAAFFGCLGYELDLKHLLPVEVREIQGQTAFYREMRMLFQFGTFRRMDNGWQVSDGKTAVAGVFHTLVGAAPGYAWLKVEGLEREKTYEITSVSQSIRIGQFGGLLKHVAPISVDPNGQLLRLADRHVTLPDGELSCTASGAALAAGIALPPLFRGTGYDKAQRNQGDFGSSLYLITCK